MMFRSIAHKLILLILLTGLVPLALFGAYALEQAGETSRETVIEGNAKLAVQVAGRMDQYVDGAIAVLRGAAAHLARAGLDEFQRMKLLRQGSLSFEQFENIRVLDRNGEMLLTSELDPGTLRAPDAGGLKAALKGTEWQSPVFITDNFVPAIEVYLPMERMGEIKEVLAARLDLLHLWKLIKGLRVGKTGYLSLMTPDGRLFATGNGPAKADAIQMKASPVFGAIMAGHGEPFRWGEDGRERLIVSVRTADPRSWILTVEQPVAEAFAAAHAIARRLALTAIVALAAVIIAGTFMAQVWVVRPVSVLMDRIRGIARGELDGRTRTGGSREFERLGQTLDGMASDIKGQREELLRRERLAVLGRVASGIVHDLKHPVASVEGYARALETKHADAGFRHDFLATVEREFARVQGFLANLSDLAKEIPFRPVAVSAANIVRETVQSFLPACESAGIDLTCEVASDFTGRFDLFSFPRVLHNLIANAVDAAGKDGRITIAVDTVTHSAPTGRITVSDTGPGIPPEMIAHIFDELKTTKKKTGLGLGLAIARKIVAQHGGTIAVENIPGGGARFRIEVSAVEGG